MGKRKAGFRRNRNALARNASGDTRKSYEDIVRENEMFEKYYKIQNICKEDEWSDFLQTLKTDLPATFRITGSKGEAKKMLVIVKGHFLADCFLQNTDEKPPIYPLPWYPDNLAWQMELTRKDIRGNESYYKWHNFLVTETENGSISRQETVSMIPPLLLDVQPHHKVLDMCAAPGSKTAQIIEMLHADEQNLPTGYLVANDVDNRRCYMLVHQAKRLSSPCVAVVNHDSAILPNFKTVLPDGSTEQIPFDRILCDVPCSGDGTMRKNPDIWMKWTPANGLNQHGIQSRILRRGIELLAVGGRLVYSTCSLNPLENEAVIHRLLNETNGAVQLVDVSNSLPGLKSTPGVETWIVSSRSLDVYNSFDEIDERWNTTIRPQMFPPKPEDREKFHLNRCVRILPHQQNTGAFFVAVLEKVKPLNAKEHFLKAIEALHCTQREPKTEADSKQRKKRKLEGCYKEDPFVFFTDEEKVWPGISGFFNISDEFDATCLLTRCLGGKKKNIYFASKSMRDLVVQNQHIFKFINTGVRTFVRSDNKRSPCAFRLAQEGLESLANFIQGRKVTIPKEDLVVLLLSDNPQQAPRTTALSESVQKQVENMSPGSCVLIYKNADDGSDTPLTLNISGWRGTHSLRCFISHSGIVHLLRLLGEDTSKFDVNKFKKGAGQKEEVVKEEVVKEVVVKKEVVKEEVVKEEVVEEVVVKKEVVKEVVVKKEVVKKEVVKEEKNE